MTPVPELFSTRLIHPPYMQGSNWRLRLRRLAWRLQRSHLQQKAVSELQALDDRTLCDIGIDRSEIVSHVRLMLDQRSPRF